MGAAIHPQMKLRIVLDEAHRHGDADAEIERRFTAVAPTEVVRAKKGSQRSNVLSFEVGMSSAGEEDDASWRDALITWLDEEFAETSALVARENDARRTKGQQELPFSWAEVCFGTGPAIAVRMIDSAIPAAAAGYVERARSLLKDGALGADPIEVIRIPACASIAARRSDVSISDALVRPAAPPSGNEHDDDTVDQGWMAADPDENNAAQTASAKRDQPTRQEIDEALSEAEAALRRGDDPADATVEERDADALAPAARVVTNVPTSLEVDTSDEGCALSGEAVPEDLDYRIWNIAYADGTSVRFDSVMGEAILD